MTRPYALRVDNNLVLLVVIAVPTQMRYQIISQGVGARHAVPLRV